jgi:Fic family protein
MIVLDKYSSGNTELDLSGYRYFVPTRVNDNWSWDNQEINKLLERAAIKIGELNSFARLVPNIDLFIQLHVTKEAVVSSKIEGTQTNIDEAFLSEADIAPERRQDWKEVKNYITALNSAIEEMRELPISSRLLRKTHEQLLDSVRGENKQPGEYRRSQNWIGGNSLHDATFIPPHHKYVDDLMGDLENFIHNQEIQVPELIRIGIVHYQFETIHPFLDGNGRIGRLLITLYLVEKQVLAKPLLYLSSYFEKNKTLYYDNLMAVRSKNDLTQWLKYFLVGIATTAEEAVNTLSQIIELKKQLEETIHPQFGRKSKQAFSLLQHLFKNPILDTNEVKRETQLSFKAANDLVADFEKQGILKEITGQTRNRLFVFDAYLNLFQ